MPERDLPEGTANEALSFDDGVDDISDLLGDPTPDLADDDQDQDVAETDPDADNGGADEVEASDDEGDDAPESDDASDDLKGGRFAPDTAKVTLDDGTVISVADLKRNNLYQRDYTRKTMELAEERKTFATQREQVIEHARSLTHQRDLILQAAQHFLPPLPDKSMIQTDIIGYNMAVADYQEKMGLIQQLAGQRAAERQQEQQAEERRREELIEQEKKKLFSTMPELIDQQKRQKFWSDAVDTMADFDFSPEELSEAYDARFYKVFAALKELKDIKSRAPKVKEAMQAKPQLLKSGRRMDPKEKTSREARQRSERLRSTGDFDAAVNALMDLDL